MAAIWQMQKRKSTISRKMGNGGFCYIYTLMCIRQPTLTFTPNCLYVLAGLPVLYRFLPFAYFGRKPCQDEADCMPAMWDKSCMKLLKN